MPRLLKRHGRGAVVRLDRTPKARMIMSVLSDFLNGPVEGFRTLDIGCGNGGISEHFASRNEHYAVDVSDRRTNSTAPYRFSLVDSERLPFPDRFFDIVISHHVIEHVNDQGLHLDEMARTTKSGGTVYIATPNRTSPFMEGHFNNDRVLRYRDMAGLFRRHGFDVHEYSVCVAGDPDRFNGEMQIGRFIPTAILKLLRPIYPSHIFVMTNRPSN